MSKSQKLTISAPIELFFAGSEDEQKAKRFRIKAYTGEVVDRWWGKLAIAVNGIQSKNNIPILLNHDSDQIVGYAESVSNLSDFRVEGKFLESTEEGKKVYAMAEEGFPWQASIGVRPLKTISVGEGTEMSVNGNMLTGPAEIWLESEVRETSFVPVGADGNTEAVTFAVEEIDQKPETKEKNMELTIEKLKSDFPDIHSAVTALAYADGANSERDRIQAVLAQELPGHQELIAKLAFDGKTSGPEAAVQVLKAENQLRANAAESLKAAPVKPVAAVAPAETKKPVTLKDRWDSDEALRDEFGNDFEVFEAFEAAQSNNLIKMRG